MDEDGFTSAQDDFAGAQDEFPCTQDDFAGAQDDFSCAQDDFSCTQDDFSCARLAILGLGLMGGSLALALKGRCAALFGIDPDEETIALANKIGAVDRASSKPSDLLPLADVIILAAPVLTILELLRRLPELHPGRAVVIDLGSTKSQIMQAMQELPARFDPLGGHPMCGKEKSGLANASADLYQGAAFAFTPLERTSARARALAIQMAQVVGAAPLWLDAQTHDRWTAATSHLPYLVAAALAQATPLEVAPLVGPGFSSSTRVAATSPGVMLDILQTNRDNLLEALGRFLGCLEILQTQVAASQWEALSASLMEGAARRGDLLEATPRGAR